MLNRDQFLAWFLASGICGVLLRLQWLTRLDRSDRWLIRQRVSGGWLKHARRWND